MVNVAWFLIGAIAGTVGMIILAVFLAEKQERDNKKEQ